MSEAKTKGGKKSGFAVLIGRPNVGKSTLMNELIGQKVAITSAKPQTTRNRIRAIYTSDEGQVIFLDTPGMIRHAKNKLGEYMRNVSVGTIGDADVVIYLVEAVNRIGDTDREIMERLKRSGAPVILAVNKIDQVKREDLLPVIDAYRREMEFAEVVPVSALKKENLDELMKCVFSYLPEGPQYYDPDLVTDQPVRAIAAEMIREKALMLLKDEIPHGIAVVIDRMEEREDRLTEIEASIICERDSHKAIIIGKGGSMLKKIGSAARYEIERMLMGKVYLKLFVKVRKDWRNSDVQLKNFGYRKDDI